MQLFSQPFGGIYKPKLCVMGSWTLLISWPKFVFLWSWEIGVQKNNGKLEIQFDIWHVWLRKYAYIRQLPVGQKQLRNCKLLHLSGFFSCPWILSRFFLFCFCGSLTASDVGMEEHFFQLFGANERQKVSARRPQQAGRPWVLARSPMAIHTFIQDAIIALAASKRMKGWKQSQWKKCIGYLQSPPEGYMHCSWTGQLQEPLCNCNCSFLSRNIWT